MNIPSLKEIIKSRIETVETLIKMYEETLADLKKELQILQSSLRFLEEAEAKEKGDVKWVVK